MFLSWVKYIIWPLYWLLESFISRSISFLLIASWIYFNLLIKSQASLKVTLPQLTLTHLWPIVSFYSPENTRRPKVFYWFHTAWKMSKYGVSFWLVFCRILTAYGNLIREPPYSAQIRENTDQKKFGIQTLFTFEFSTFHSKEEQRSPSIQIW